MKFEKSPVFIHLFTRKKIYWNINIILGHIPFFVAVTSGTTVLGAFDPINEVADICDKYGMWLHVDVSSPTMQQMYINNFYTFLGRLGRWPVTIKEVPASEVKRNRKVSIFIFSTSALSTQITSFIGLKKNPQNRSPKINIPIPLA